MKKVALTLASVAAIVAFAPEASALPVFARQTGMACSACHFQHFPLLNGFGRAFKANAYTMMGSEPLVEGEHLSIPDRLNMAVFTTAYMQQQSGGDLPTAATLASPTTVTNGTYTGQNSKYGVPSSGGELSIFYGGRVSEFAGFLSELGLKGTGANAGTNSAKLVMLFPVGDMRMGVSAYSTTGAGAAYSFEYLNTGAVQNHKMMDNPGPSNQHVSAAYAGQYLGTAANATGASLVANGSWGFVNIGKYAPGGAGTGNATDLPLNYARAALTLDLAGWDTAIGVQHYSGDNASLVTPLGLTASNYNANIVDAQAQGELAGMETGFYVSYGVAPSSGNNNALAGTGSALSLSAAALGNMTGTAAANVITATGVTAGSAGSSTSMGVTTLNLAASMEIVPHTATVQAAYRKATWTPDAGNASGTTAALDDNAYMIGATYELAMNMGLGLNYTVQSGSAWDALDKAYKAQGISGAPGKSAWTMLLTAAF